MSKEKADELGLKPLCTIKSYASAGVDPSIMGVGPVPASKKALDKAGLAIEDIDLVEANEAFAAQSLAVRQRTSNLDPEKTNVNGGAIATRTPYRSIRMQDPYHTDLRDDEERFQIRFGYFMYRRRTWEQLLSLKDNRDRILNLRT